MPETEKVLHSAPAKAFVVPVVAPSDAPAALIVAPTALDGAPAKAFVAPVVAPSGPLRLPCAAALSQGAACLVRSDTPYLDASLLLAHHLQWSRETLLANTAVQMDIPAAYFDNIKRRAAGESIAYILGRKEFFGRDFMVDVRVLVPRPDTEILVQAALECGDALMAQAASAAATENMRPPAGPAAATTAAAPESVSAAATENMRPPAGGGGGSTERALRLHDLCTGSGAVAVSIAAERPHWRVSASDISCDALKVAAENACVILGHCTPSAPGLEPDANAFQRRGDNNDNHDNNSDRKRADNSCNSSPNSSPNSSNGPVIMRQADIRAGMRDALSDLAPFDIITANPPYVPSAESASLLAEEGWGEPALALDGGPDGLGLLRAMLPQLPALLAPGGVLLVEADGTQAEAVAELFSRAGFLAVRHWKDLAGISRVTGGIAP